MTMSNYDKARPLFDPPIVRRAIVDSFAKLDPRRQLRNPVMFTVFVGSMLTTGLGVHALVTAGRRSRRRSSSASRRGCGSPCCLPTSPKRWPKGAARRRPTRCGRRAATCTAKKLDEPRSRRDASDPSRRRRLRKGRRRARRSGRPDSRATAKSIEGVASVDESAITGESAPVIRESGGDRSSVTGGTRVLSDWLVVRVTANPGETFLDRMIALVEGAKRQKTPNEIALDILLAAMTIIFLLVCATLLPFSKYSVAAAGQGSADHGDGARRAARLPDSDDDRRAALGHRHRGHGSHDSGERDRHVGPRGRSGRRRRCAAARQDRHDHARQSAGGRVRSRAGRRRSNSWPMRRSWRRWPMKRPKAAASSCWPRRSTACAAATCTICSAHVHSVHRADADERRRPRRPPDSQRRGRRDRAVRSRARRRLSRRAFASRSNEIAKQGRHAAGRRGRQPARSASIYLKDIVKGGIKERFAELRRMGIKTVMITGDNPLTAAAIAAEAGVDDFLAEATPEAKLKMIREYQAGGRLVAMTGDGTNDAPALAQADVAVAMNSGTQAAKEAGNMVDLDSNPTKLIEIVEIGKQLLMTRGALTTFSIANDVAKYFAIIPAAFATTYPVLDKLNVMGLATPVERDPVGGDLQRAHHRCADSAGAARRAVSRRRRGAVAARQPAHLRPRRPDRAVHRHQGDRPAAGRAADGIRRSFMFRLLRQAIVVFLVLTLITGVAYPLLITGVAQVVFPHQANGSLIERDGKLVGSELIGQQFDEPKVLLESPVGHVAGVQRRCVDWQQSWADESRAARRREGRVSKRSRKRIRTRQGDVPVDLVTASGSGLDPHISPAAAEYQVARVAKARGVEASIVQHLSKNTQRTELAYSVNRESTYWS